jgi:hypothetical protein
LPAYSTAFLLRPRQGCGDDVYHVRSFLQALAEVCIPVSPYVCLEEEQLERGLRELGHTSTLRLLYIPVIIASAAPFYSATEP